MKLILALFIAVVGVSAFGQQDAVSFKSTELVPGLVMMEGVGAFTGGNVALWSGADGVVLIDDGIPQVYGKLLDAIRSHTGKSVNYLINTHVHGDHIGNNEGFSESGATIYAHHNIRKRMLSDGVTGANGQAPATAHMLPEVTFAREVSLHLNGGRANLIHVPHAHTDGDAIVHFPDADVIHTGDVLFNGLYPFIDLDSGGSVNGYIAGLNQIISIAGAGTKIIPGHGPLATKKDVQAARDMLVDVRDRVRKLVADGKSEDDIVAAAPLSGYDKDWTWGFITTEKMTRMLVKDAGGSTSRH